MHRQSLLQLIDRYDKVHPEEAELVERFRTFVMAHSDCFERSLIPGHITSSCWLVNAEEDEVLLTHHRKLNIWVQPGGHTDGESDVLASALRESLEESGLTEIEPISGDIFDLDIHTIPERKGEPAHEHFDVRFALRHTGSGDYVISEESHDLAWVPIHSLQTVTREESMLRMARKWLERLGNSS